jgi:hypothetical protein
MSATLGDITAIVDLLERQTGTSVTTVLDAPRPVPLTYEYVETSLEATVELALRAKKDPLYIVHFSQRAALESARNLANFGVADKEVVKVRVESERSAELDDVIVRVSPKYALAMHIDTDESNATCAFGTIYGTVIKK